MQDPVVDNNGNTYERHAITDWIQRNHTSPLTRGPLELTDLRPNRALKDMIDAALEQRAATTPQSETKTCTPEDGFQPPSVSLHLTTGRTHTQGLSCLATIQVPENTVPTPVDICVVIDTSGSMCSEAKMQGASGISESHGLSILDVVKHATRTIIEALGPEDRLAIVAYSSQAHSVLPLTVMHNGGKALAKSALSTLRPSGSTNLWDGLKMGMDLLANDADPHRLTSCFILTDGCPNIVPPRGHLSMLRRYKDSANKNFSCVINTYGFGYNLDSTLLDDIAREGQGSYSFIPDSGFVGTCFTNSLANLCSTMGKQVKLTLEPIGDGTHFEIERYDSVVGDADDEDDAVIGKRRQGTLGGHPCTRTSWGWSLDLGCLRSGQTKDIVVRLTSTSDAQQCSSLPSLRATLSYDHVGPSSCLSNTTLETTASVVTDVQLQQFNADLLYHTCRLEAVDTMYQAHQVLKAGQWTQGKVQLGEFISKLKSYALDKRGRDLMKDLMGQVTEAISNEEYFTKWGQHYLPSLAGAHLLQLCCNFKDPGVQMYGGTLFETLRDRIDTLFNNLPPPKPSRQVVQTTGAAPLTSMARYNCRSAPCFPGSAMVCCAEKNTVITQRRRVDSLVKGDLVLTEKGTYVAIDAIVKTVCDNGKQELVTLNNMKGKGSLQVTPWHPIKINSKWCFPNTLVEEGHGTKTVMECEAVFSFMLEKKHSSMMINGVECITLGQGIENDCVAFHPFYGTDLVRQNVQRLKGYASGGLVELKGGTCVQRDCDTGLVCRLYQ